MAYRLVARLATGTVRFPLREGDTLIGSDAGCDLQLDHPSVSRRHAILRRDGCDVTVDDLGSSNGTLVGHRRVTREAVPCGTPIYFGRVAAVIEELPDDDLEPGLDVAARPAAQDVPLARGEPTAQLAPVDQFALQHLPQLAAALADGATPDAVARLVGHALFLTLPCLEVTVARNSRGAAGILFTARAPDTAGDAPASADVEQRGYRVSLGFATAALADAYRPLAVGAVGLIAAAERGSRRREIGRGTPGDGLPPPLPEPPSIEPRVRGIYEQAARVARGDVAVLITGESGTGKEVLARYLHRASARSDGPFVALNCAALPRDLLEAELFGIERGVATGVDSRPGRFELADGGTLFLDEIGDMAPDTQARILRVLQEREVYRLGGREPRPARIRVVSATNRDLAAQLADGRFREDLYHRIATWIVDLPPLRQRKADLPTLAAHFLEREAARHGRRIGGLTKGALAALAAYTWPGNIRQLENEMARAVLFLEDGDMLDSTRLTEAIRTGRPASTTGRRLDATLAAVERDEIRHALDVCGGDIAAVCERLGISRATLYRRMKALAIEETPRPAEPGRSA